MLKKILLILVLLGAVIAIGYYQATRQEAEQKEQFRQGALKGEREASLSSQKADSLRGLVSRERKEFADSLTLVEQSRKTESDSLRQVIADKDQELKQTGNRKRGTSPRASISKAEKPDSSVDTRKHAQILAYYKKRIDGLPKDLSDYERRVALNEVREETARKFSISGAEFDKIRQDTSLGD